MRDSSTRLSMCSVLCGMLTSDFLPFLLSVARLRYHCYPSPPSPSSAPRGPRTRFRPLQTATVTYIPTWLGSWFTFLILFNNFIPISLYVTVEMVNYGQAWLIDNDAAMYDPESDTPAKARTSNLNQDLGQIEYVFSDKTGTLTRNVMEFKQLSVAGRVFGVFVAESDIAGGDDAEGPDPAAISVGLFASIADGCSCCCNRRRGAGSAGGVVSSTGGVVRGSVAGVEMSNGAAGGRAPNPLRNGEDAAAAAGGAAAAARRTSSSPRSPKSIAAAAAAAGSGFDDPVILSLLRNNSGADGRPVPLGWGGEWTPAIAATAGAQALADPRLTGWPQGSGAGSTVNPMPAVGAAVSPEAIIALEAFFTCMAVCHTVVPEVNEDDPSGPAIYQAESPDEAALTKAARDAGFEFISRAADSIVMARRNGAKRADYKFLIHGVHEFNSTRKRMSVVCQAPDGRYFIMVKGADNVIFDRAVGEPHRRELDTHLTRFASDGLRTLVLAQREMTAAEFSEWKEEHMTAAMALANREDLLAAVAERFERNLHVLGATAIEDRLQDGVPGTIRDLARAGIKTWVLTGDKVETAINIGFSCRLLDSAMELIKVAEEEERLVVAKLALLERRFHPLVNNPDGVLKRVLRTSSTAAKGQRALANVVVTGDDEHALASGEHGGVPAPAPAPTGGASRAAGAAGGGMASHSEPSRQSGLRLDTNMALIITGPALNFIMGHADRERALLTVARCCRAVIACRVSPQQKANIVKMVRFGITPRPMTLAIGDGANDVGMIQRAEVGIGISGKEGLQAVNSADFAIAQFRFLRRLLLVHGRWDYRRMTKVVLYSFYKNVVITLSLFYYTSLTGFSGTSFYESIVYSTYNFVLGLPIIFAGILDRDISARTALRHPAVYAVGLRYEDLNLRKILMWIWWAVLHSVLVFWPVYGIMGYKSPTTPNAPVEGSWRQDGLQEGLYVAGTTQYCAMVWAMQFEVGMQIISWTWLSYFMIAFSMAGFHLFLGVYANMRSFAPEFYGVAAETFGRADYWLIVILVVVMVAVLDYSTELLRRMLRPTSSDIAMELDRGYGTRASNGQLLWGDEEGPGAHNTGSGGAGGASAPGPATLVHPRRDASVAPAIGGSSGGGGSAPGLAASGGSINGGSASLLGAGGGSRTAMSHAEAARASVHVGGAAASSHHATGRSRQRVAGPGAGGGSPGGSDGEDGDSGGDPTHHAGSQNTHTHTGSTPLRAAHAAAAAADAGGSAAVTVPSDYVLAGLSTRDRAALGISSAAGETGYNFTSPPRHAQATPGGAGGSAGGGPGTPGGGQPDDDDVPSVALGRAGGARGSARGSAAVTAIAAALADDNGSDDDDDHDGAAGDSKDGRRDGKRSSSSAAAGGSAAAGSRPASEAAAFRSAVAGFGDRMSTRSAAPGPAAGAGAGAGAGAVGGASAI